MRKGVRFRKKEENIMYKEKDKKGEKYVQVGDGRETWEKVGRYRWENKYVGICGNRERIYRGIYL